MVLVDQKTATVVAAVLGVVGLLLILAGPAFHFIPGNIGVFLAIAAWVIAGVIKSLYGKKGKVKKED